MVSSRISVDNTSVNGNNDQLGLVYGHKLSSVGPARVTGDLVYEPSNLDLAMKLHYLRVVYLLDSQTSEGLTTTKIKKAAFSWLCYYYESCARLRRSVAAVDAAAAGGGVGGGGGGRPYMKCNDCGVRFVEAKSNLTLEEWLQMEDTSPQRLLVANNVIGPELGYSPLVFLQVTSFKCGGLSLGLSWAHVLGDASSLAQYMNSLANFLNGQHPTHPPKLKNSPRNDQEPTKPTTSSPLSLKKVGPVGDHWTIPTPCDMHTFTFNVTAAQLAHLQMEVYGTKQTLSPAQTFEPICAVIWKAIAKVKDGPEPNVVTVVKQASNGPNPADMILRNSQVVSSAKAHFSVVEAHLKDLAELIRNWAQDERAQIGEVVGRDPGGSDFIMYGSNPTFVDLGEVDFYGFELKGLRPKLVNCFVDNIGGEGVVLVLPSTKNGDGDNNNKNDHNNNNNKIGDDGRVVTLILPKTYMEEVKQELKRKWAFDV